MWFKKEKPPTVMMICVSQCAQCNAPIYGPASMEVLRDINTETLMKELSAKVINFCVCKGREDFGSIFDKKDSIPEGN